MKKWLIVLLIIIGLYIVGCSAEEDVSSLSEFDMVHMEDEGSKMTKQCFLNKNDCQDFI